MNRHKLTLIIIVLLSVGAGIFSYQPLWQKISGFRPWSLGLDLEGGSYLIYDVDTKNIRAEETDSVLNGLRDVIERRVNLFGVSEPRVFVQKGGGVSRLVVELAGVRNISEAIKQIGETPLLDFREVRISPDPKQSEGEDEKFSIPTEEGSQPLSEATNEPQFIPTDLTGRYVKSAQVVFGGGSAGGNLGPAVALEFDKEGAKIFAEITAKNIGRPLAVFLDNELITMPTVQTKIEGGKAEITGNFTVEEAKKLVGRFNAGALPAPITLVNQETVSPELGQGSLMKAMRAGAIGTLLVILFIILYYRSYGVFASLALLMYIALTLAMFKIIPITLTLSGIAGLVLSVGMAVDANILIFERMKEELKRGLSKTDAIEEGFARAWSSIRDSNITTILTSLILYYMTSSFVRGFALALLVGVIMSMFSAITITRTLLRVFVSNPKLEIIPPQRDPARGGEN
ncbi:MAG: protein translocase subunit SecD [Nanoarchaeota archaeon]|nr:protein translocase subunit SecD [Nanoarchaeota archaeon]